MSDRMATEEAITSATELTTALLTAYFKHINKHRGIPNVVVLTGISTLNAAVVDLITHREDEHLSEAVVNLIRDTTMKALTDKAPLRMLVRLATQGTST